MRRQLFAFALILASSAAGLSGSEGQERKTDGREWIVGSWRSYKLNYGDFREWKGEAQIEVVAKSPQDIGLFLLAADGKRSRAMDSEPAILDDKTLFFGPIGSGLSFRFRRPSDDVLILDLNAKDTPIHAELRRQKK